MRPTSIYSLSTELGANTIDPYELNCRVRNGNGCDLVGINLSIRVFDIAGKKINVKKFCIPPIVNRILYSLGWRTRYNPSKHG